MKYTILEDQSLQLIATGPYQHKLVPIEKHDGQVIYRARIFDPVTNESLYGNKRFCLNGEGELVQFVGWRKATGYKQIRPKVDQSKIITQQRINQLVPKSYKYQPGQPGPWDFTLAVFTTDENRCNLCCRTRDAECAALCHPNIRFVATKASIQPEPVPEPSASIFDGMTREQRDQYKLDYEHGKAGAEDYRQKIDDLHDKAGVPRPSWPKMRRPNSTEYIYPHADLELSTPEWDRQQAVHDLIAAGADPEEASWVETPEEYEHLMASITNGVF